MAYTILQHRRVKNTRHLVIDTGIQTTAGIAITETFEWGMDVLIAAVRKETRALLDAKYDTSAVTLAGEKAAL